MDDDSHSIESSSSEVPQDAEISESNRNRVRLVDPNEGHCIVENCPDVDLVDFCHYFPKEFMSDDSLMSNIEWHWNMKLYTLNFDSYRNIFLASVTFHALYDRNKWMLLPDQDIIEQYHQLLLHKDHEWIATRESFPKIPNRNDFRYTLLPLANGMRSVPIHRQDNVPALRREDITSHFYPYATMPVLKSHLHPKYVILEAGRRLNLLSTPIILQLTERYPTLVKIRQIFGAWTVDPPSDAMNDTSYYSVRADHSGFLANNLRKQ